MIRTRPYLHVVLHQPEIPANAGNIARLCGAAELRLHLIHPLGFKVDDKHLKRAGLDYWSEIDLCHHESFEAFLASKEEGRLITFSRWAYVTLFPRESTSRNRQNGAWELMH